MREIDNVVAGEDARFCACPNRRTSFVQWFDEWKVDRVSAQFLTHWYRWKLGLLVLVGDAILLFNFGMQQMSVQSATNKAWDPFFQSALWNGQLDGSFIESFGQLKLIMSTVLLIQFTHQVRECPVLLVWALIFVLLVVDDRFRIHEEVGRQLASSRPEGYLEANGAQEVGGLVFWAVCCFALGAMLVRAYHHSKVAARRMTSAMLWASLPLVCVAMGYVVFSALYPEQIGKVAGMVMADIRVVIKLLTTTALLLITAHFKDVTTIC